MKNIITISALIFGLCAIACGGVEGGTDDGYTDPTVGAGVEINFGVSPDLTTEQMTLFMDALNEWREALPQSNIFTTIVDNVNDPRFIHVRPFSSHPNGDGWHTGSVYSLAVVWVADDAAGYQCAKSSAMSAIGSAFATTYTKLPAGEGDPSAIMREGNACATRVTADDIAWVAEVTQ